MNKIALVTLSLFAIIEVLISNISIYEVPLWLIGLMIFTVIWMAILKLAEMKHFQDF